MLAVEFAAPIFLALSRKLTYVLYVTALVLLSLVHVHQSCY